MQRLDGDRDCPRVLDASSLGQLRQQQVIHIRRLSRGHGRVVVLCLPPAAKGLPALQPTSPLGGEVGVTECRFLGSLSPANLMDSDGAPAEEQDHASLPIWRAQQRLSGCPEPAFRHGPPSIFAQGLGVPLGEGRAADAQHQPGPVSHLQAARGQEAPLLPLLQNVSESQLLVKLTKQENAVLVPSHGHTQVTAKLRTGTLENHLKPS